MKFSYNWIKELSGTQKTTEEVAELFLTHSFEVEGIEDLAKGLEGIVVGEVLSVEKHPDADRLKVAKVNVTASQSQTDADETQTNTEKNNDGELQIVCGAPNLKVGQKVPVALVGANLVVKDKNGDEQIFKIKKGKIRGMESNGMICAEDELGLGDDHEGIMVLTAPQSQINADLTLTNVEKLKVGQNFAEYMNLEDKILDIDILPNRGHDCLGYNGIAGELMALENGIVDGKEYGEVENFGDKLNLENNSNFKVDIKTSNCLRYAGVKINNITIESSPLWMQARLKASGIKSINNIVDITNYVMLETGQPLHAFDSESVSSQKSKVKSQKNCQISVRQAEKGEKLKLLDEQELGLSEEDVVITNGKKVIALAGVMGGEKSGIQDDTKNIILEGANFNSTSIRFTARRYNLQTDAAYRFERDIDPNFVDIAMTRVIELIEELAGGEIVSMTDVYPNVIKPWQVELSLEHVRKLLGVDISAKEVVGILERLGMDVDNNNGTLICIIPTRRRDLQTSEDLIEEIGRVYGYNRIEPIAVQATVQSPKRNEQRFFERRLKEIAVQDGFSEIRGYSFYSQDDANALGIGEMRHISLMNPASPEQAILRNTLASGLLKAERKSLSYFKEVRVFEVGRIYKDRGKTLPQEEFYFGGAVATKNDSGEQFYELKGLIDNFLESFGISGYYYDDVFDEKEGGKHLDLHSSRRALLKNNKGEIIGWLGEIDKKVTKYFGLKNVRVALCEINIDKLRDKVEEIMAYQPLSKFPFMERDLSVIVSKKLRVKEVEDVLFKAGGKLIKDVDLFDLYNNEQAGEKSMAFHLIFGDEEKTLETEEVDNKMTEIIKTVEDELGVEVKK